MPDDTPILQWRWALRMVLIAALELTGGLNVLARGAGEPSSKTELRIGIVGDQFGVLNINDDPYPTLSQGLALLAQKKVQVILHVGDLIEGVGQPPAEYAARFKRAAAILDQAQIPWFLTPGDHDVNPQEWTPNSNDHSIEKLFFSNYHSRRPSLTPRLYYSFDVDRYHFIALNSLEHLRTEPRWGDVFLSGISDEQFAWLEEDLAQHRSSPGIIVFTHQPLWYNFGAWQRVHRLLRKYPVRAVIAGHFHYSQDEGEIDGIRYIVVGATGAGVKSGSPEAGDAQVVTLMTLEGERVQLELLPIGSALPTNFSSRLDMDRVQALGVGLSNLDLWQWDDTNTVCLKDGKTVMPYQGDLPAVVQLRAIGNPIDIPVGVEIRVDADGLKPIRGKFASDLCAAQSGEACVVPPGKNVKMANNSAVQFRWPDKTEVSTVPPVETLPVQWEASLAAAGTEIKPGTTLHVKLRFSFQGEGGVRYLESDLQRVVNNCGRTYALSGTIVTPHGVIDNGVILVVNSTIQSVGTNVPLPAGTSALKTDGVIFPGLIDLHNHLVWNVFPRWTLPSTVGNRYDWQALPEYTARLSGPEGALINRDMGCDMERYAEIKALLGGATSVAGSFSPTDSDPHRNDCDRGLARNLDFVSGLYSANMNQEPLRYEVFPFELGWQQAQTIRDWLASRQLKTLLIHVAEGKDASADREFRMLRASGFLRPGVSIIHGVALRPAEFRELAANGVGLIWSPRSNFELYGKTADVVAAKEAGITMALAPDWSPTGSSSVLEELHYAYQWNGKQSPKPFEDGELIALVTANPARLAAVSDKIGALVPGMAADLIVLPSKGESAASALLEAQPGSLKLVVVGGRPILGDPELMRSLLPDRTLDSLTVCGRPKALDIAEDMAGESWKEIETHLTNALEPFHIALAPLAECH